jgi:hypothetical protein
MAYFVGKDVKVWICTEYGATDHPHRGIRIGTDHELEVINNNADDTDTLANGSKQVYPMGTQLGYAGFNISDITGVDLSLGASDEEIAFFGTKTPGKIQTKADCAVTLTRKKSDKLWSTLAQGKTDSGHSYGSGGHTGRWGLIKESGSGTDAKIADGTVDPKSSTNGSVVTYGYRVAVQLKGSTEVVILRNCTFGEYTTSLSNDAANDETINFVTMVDPLFLDGAIASNVFTGGVEETAAADM